MSATKREHFKRDYLGFRPWTRHSMVLFVGGFVYISNGLSGFTVEPGEPRWVALVSARDWLPLNVWHVIWIMVGVGALLSSVWPPAAESWGYTLMAGLAALWGGFYGAGVVFQDQMTANLSLTGVWWLVAFMWWAVSGLKNPQRPERPGGNATGLADS